MKIISTKEYNELKKTQSAYLDLLMKPLQGVFEKVTDDDLLRDNANLYAENKKLHSIIKEVREYIEKNKASLPTGRDDFTCEMRYSDPVVLASKLLEILDR